MGKTVGCSPANVPKAREVMSQPYTAHEKTHQLSSVGSFVALSGTDLGVLA